MGLEQHLPTQPVRRVRLAADGRPVDPLADPAVADEHDVVQVEGYGARIV